MDRVLLCIGCQQRKPVKDVPIYGGPGSMRFRGVCRDCCKNPLNLEKYYADNLYYRVLEARIELFLAENPLPF